jgi:hypothetical protein
MLTANRRALRWRGNSEPGIIYDQDKQKAERVNVAPGLKLNRIVWLEIYLLSPLTQNYCWQPLPGEIEPGIIYGVDNNKAKPIAFKSNERFIFSFRKERQFDVALVCSCQDIIFERPIKRSTKYGGANNFT